MSNKSNKVNARLKSCPTDFIKQIGQLLQKFRKKAILSQAEIAIEVGLSKTSGFKYISWLETGRIKNPSLLTILRYLKACQVPYPAFFQELAEIDFKIEHENIMRQVEMPSNIIPHLRRKISRDTAKYVHKIVYPKTPYQKLDWARIKEKVLKKVKILLTNLLIEESKKTPYFNYVNELIEKYNTDQAVAVFEKYYNNKTLRQGAIHNIRNIVYQAVRREEKRLVKPKPLTQEKLHKMAKGFIKHRIKIEPIEAEVQKLLGELNVPIAYNQAYKDFTRECVKALNKFSIKDPIFLKQKLNEIKNWWTLNKLEPEVLDKVKDVVVKTYFQKQKYYSGTEKNRN